jgi:1-deoxy-D-xylulose-5-phosphate reductoisomerase
MSVRVAILGSTGSIGRQALEILEGPLALGAGLSVHSLVCGSNGQLLSEQVERFCPEVAGLVLPDEGEVCSFPGRITGPESIEAACEGADVVLNAIVGSAGLDASLLCAALRKPLVLANKESLVVGGELLVSAIADGLVVPVDSEHSTLYRCIEGEMLRPRRIFLTASGGATLRMSEREIRTAGPEMILRHPNWDMGPRITVDSSSMVNKAFEVIEAKWLFSVPFESIEVVLHPESLVHSFVELPDGSLKSLAGHPDMRVPVAWGLARAAAMTRGGVHDGLELLFDADCGDPRDWGELHFRPLDRSRYPAFDLVVQAGLAGGTAPAVANAADEIAVGAFLAGEIRFGAIPHVIEKVLSAHAPHGDRLSREIIVEADRWARAKARDAVKELRC